jgi:flagellar P-ring protein precursor FlgI
MRRMMFFLGAALALVGEFCAQSLAGVTVGEIARLKDNGGSVIQGLGLVMGLNGTGDSGKDPMLARALLEFHRNNGNTLGGIEELKTTRTVALVTVMCSIPDGGWQADDRFDVTVAAVGNSTSLEGGVLYLAPLRGPWADPNPETNPIFAMASGPIVLENAKQPRSGRVRNGAQMIREMPRTRELTSTFTIVLNKPYAGYSAASEIASSITQNIYGKAGRALAGLPPIATVLDDRCIRIDIPEAEQENAPAFVGDVMATPVTVALLKLPKQVIYNQQSGKIVVTGDVEISPVALTSADLTITTTMPAPTPTPDNPMVETKRWTAIAPGAKETERARLNDLLNAFNQLNIAVTDQIALLEMMEKAGKLHAKLVRD